MAGHLTQHPYLKTWDELTRSINRMKNYLRSFGGTLTEGEIRAVENMITFMEEAANYTPEKYQVSRYKQFKKEE